MKRYLLCFFLFTIVFSCKKKDVTSPTDFNIVLNNLTYKVGDTVKFQLIGNADYISFYPGDSGYNYVNRNTVSSVGKVTMSFKSRLTQGSTDSTAQQNTLRVLMSNNFVTPSAGYIIDSSTVIAAGPTVWTDITNRFTLPKVPSNTAVSSGVADLTDIAKVSEGKPVYLAFKFSDKYDSLIAQRFWYLTNLTIDNTLSDSTKNNVFLLINKSPTPLFSIVNIKNPDVKWGIGSSTAQISIQGGAAKTAENEDWLITRAMNLSLAFPDKSIPIKSIADNSVSSVTKVYTKAGVYQAVFVARNQNVYGSNEVVRTVTINVIQ